jgi:cytochrome c oxidase accessory protein FixG
MEERQTTFRDRLTTINESGGRQWVYAKKPGGRFYTYRQLVGYFLLILFLSGPFITIQGQPLLLMDVIHRRFIILGQVFHTQDFYLFALAMLSFIVFIVLFTVIYGRIWCGWACPQTIFMELVFRRIEYLIEGDGLKQKRAAGKPLTVGLAFRKTIKHIIFYLISFIISLYLISYLVGKEKILEIIKTGHFGGYLAFFIFSFVFYGIFAWLREQSCTLICPYGRLQGVLLDDNSLVVAYDYKRGEPRSLFRRNEDRQSTGKGDCVDCSSCVRVCPTGIDIRNGTQLECVNCTACIDACNGIMKRFHMPKGLIRFASLNGIEKGKKFGFTPRVFFYSVILLGLMVLFSSLLFLRSDIDTTIERTKGQLYQEMGDSAVGNLYNISITNKSNKDYTVQIRLLSPGGRIQQIGKPIEIGANDNADGVFFAIIPRDSITSKNMQIKLGVYANGEKMNETEAPFVGPNQ